MTFIGFKHRIHSLEIYTLYSINYNSNIPQEVAKDDLYTNSCGLQIRCTQFSYKLNTLDLLFLCNFLAYFHLYGTKPSKVCHTCSKNLMFLVLNDQIILIHYLDLQFYFYKSNLYFLFHYHNLITNCCSNFVLIFEIGNYFLSIALE